MGEVAGDGDGGGRTSHGIRTEYDWTTTEPSVAIVESIAVLEGTDPLAFPEDGDLVLHEHVDVDALDRLVGGHQQGVSDVTVEIDGYTVQISDEALVVSRRDRPVS
jgi:hypothetical protein